MTRPEGRADVIVSLAATVDGFVADAAGGVGFLEAYDPSALGFDAFLAGIDTIILGRTTFDQVQAHGSWPYAGKRGVLVTSRPALLPEGMVAIPPDPARLAPALASLGARRAWHVGGPRTIALAHAAGLVDWLELYVVPLTLGAGLPLGFPAAPLALEDSEALPAGVVRLRWRVRGP